MLDFSLWMPMWKMDFEFGLFGKEYFQGLVADSTISAEQYKEITGEDYVAPAQPTQPAGK